MQTQMVYTSSLQHLPERLRLSDKAAAVLEQQAWLSCLCAEAALLHWLEQSYG